MFGSHLHKFRKLNLQQQVYALCLIALRKVSVNMIFDWMAFALDTELSERQIIEITKTYNKIESKIEWGNKEKNEQIIQIQIGIDPKDMHKIVADSLWKDLGMDEKELKGHK
jgi:hypothetical protein